MAGEFGDARGRWGRFGPYYAMFPVAFSDFVIDSFLPEGGVLLDPFMGRGTSVFSAAASGRQGIGFDVSKVAWVYAKTKLQPAMEGNVLRRLQAIDKASKAPMPDLPEFFDRCFSKQVLEFLLKARRDLDWKDSQVDRTLMAFIIYYLHGKREHSLSNQMRQAKAMAPNYSIDWWAAKGMKPPAVDVIPFLSKRIKWRYKHGIQDTQGSNAYLGDATKRLFPVCRQIGLEFDLLFTSPPYCGITDYEYDQWLRNWMLGGPPSPRYSEQDRSGKHGDQRKYKQLLNTTFQKAAYCMKDSATIYIRTDARKFTREATLEALQGAFPSRTWYEYARPFERNTQTHLYGDFSQKPGEIDFVSVAQPEKLIQLSQSRRIPVETQILIPQ